jgi:GH15 family glucan-1,4-alpha-glucosidase
LSNLNLAVIGNCSYSALVDSHARIVWCCLPRFDSEPRFSSLLNNSSEDAQGVFAIDLLGVASSKQRYRPNTAIVETELHDENGSAILITDFAPRFKRFGRVFRPGAMIRQVKTLSGTPRIRVRLRPTGGFAQQQPERTHGSNHIRYVMPDLTLRLTTNASVNYVLEEVPFIVDEPLTFFLGPDETLTVPVSEAFREYFQETEQYWIEWSRYLTLPFEWQEDVNRAAISLKLSHFEETGAVIAAPTTSIPEAPDSGRNWDYRFCWLRDSYFVVHALNALGATKTMEGYLNYIMNIAAMSEDGYLQPVFGITLTQQLHEAEISSLAGYRAMGPVRVGNDAYRQIQNDGYGSVILACTQAFFDSRLSRKGDETLFRRLEVLGRRAKACWDQPDAGLWELRQRQEVHTYSSVMCWAACDRLAKIAAQLKLNERAYEWNQAASHIRERILDKAWNEKLNSFTSTFGGDAVDAVLLLLPSLGIIKGDDPRFASTVAQIEKELLRGQFIARYSGEDDFGKPQVAFNACTFWYIDALTLLGRKDEARKLFENMLALRNPLGLLSEDIDPVTGELWGNFPQTYSMVGLIHSAMKLSKSWEEAF